VALTRCARGVAIEENPRPFEVVAISGDVYVKEPSVEDTISILRGLKEKYDLHHGLRISDSALVAAATLSNRYITDRFLPNKAIDLVGEAAARLKMPSIPSRRFVFLKTEGRAGYCQGDVPPAQPNLKGPSPTPNNGGTPLRLALS
jgi:hypothetical protein